MKTVDPSLPRVVRQAEESVPDDIVEVDPAGSPMAVSIAGFSTACSKDALVSSTKKVVKALTTG